MNEEQGKLDFDYFQVDLGEFHQLEAFLRELEPLVDPGVVRVCVQDHIAKHCTPRAIMNGLYHALSAREYQRGGGVIGNQMRAINDAFRGWHSAREETERE